MQASFLCAGSVVVTHGLSRSEARRDPSGLRTGPVSPKGPAGGYAATEPPGKPGGQTLNH